MGRKKKEVSQPIPEIVVDKNPITLLPLKCKNQKQKFFREQIKSYSLQICCNHT